MSDHREHGKKPRAVVAALNGRPRKTLGWKTRPRRSMSSYTPVDKAVLRRPLEPGQYTCFTFTAHLIVSGIDASIGIAGDGLDNALRESTTGLYKTELIKPRGPWGNLADVELATAEYLDWFNTRRLQTAIGGVPPAEYEAAYYAQTQPNPEAGPEY